MAEKDDIIRQEESKNQILREHLNRFVQIADEKNMELYSLRYEANGAINELQSRIEQLTTQVQDLRNEVNALKNQVYLVLKTFNFGSRYTELC